MTVEGFQPSFFFGEPDLKRLKQILVYGSMRKAKLGKNTKIQEVSE